MLVGLFIFFKDFGSKFGGTNQVAVVPTPTPTPTLEASPSASVASPSATLVAKSALKIMVINGNGLPGDAGRLEKILNALGYTASDTDTASVQGQRVTNLKVSSKVPPSYLEEIKASVEDDYVQVEVGNNPDKGTDIEIVVGTRG